MSAMIHYVKIAYFKRSGKDYKNMIGNILSWALFNIILFLQACLQNNNMIQSISFVFCITTEKFAQK